MLSNQPQPVRSINVRGWAIATVCVAAVLVMCRLWLPFGPGGNETMKAQLCEANLHDLALALTQYVEDNDNTYPRGVLADSNGVGWSAQLAAYTKSPGVLICPSDFRAVAPNMNVISYGYNANVARAFSESTQTEPSVTVLLFEVSQSTAGNIPPNPSSTDPWIRDGATTFAPAGDGTDGSLLDTISKQRTRSRYATGILGERPPQPTDSQYDGRSGRHFDAANYLLADGHAAVLHGDQVSTGPTAADPADPQSGQTTGRAGGTSNGKFAVTFSVE